MNLIFRRPKCFQLFGTNKLFGIAEYWFYLKYPAKFLRLGFYIMRDCSTPSILLVLLNIFFYLQSPTKFRMLGFWYHAWLFYAIYTSISILLFIIDYYLVLIPLSLLGIFGFFIINSWSKFLRLSVGILQADLN